ncbi:MAG: sigma-70 family RNA polymerase sigma factor [Ignavibacteriota bacterium]
MREIAENRNYAVTDGDEYTLARNSIGKLRNDKYTSNKEDISLLTRIAHGDQKSLAILYDKYARLIYSLIMRIIRNADEAHELQQDVFMQVWQKASLFDHERGSFVSWLVTLAHNKAINLLRSKRYKHSQLDAKEDISELNGDALTSRQTPYSTVLAADEAHNLRMALQQIPELQRNALWMAYFDGYTQREIASMLGEPLGTIKTRMRTGMLRLAALLEEN